MANPKRKISKSKRDKRRTPWMNLLKKVSLSTCPNCGEPKLPHRVCSSCGYYKGQQVFTPSE
ncbi:50S ribosomal protein L32 [candidate division KSB1 bacterium 4484_188]|nr:MAG: 50S ribosomal protein L32 [candidate division KSB1 bacterium 4484_188]HFE63851.1 50S ribosomal protein L32 [Caldithrix sp.]